MFTNVYLLAFLAISVNCRFIKPRNIFYTIDESLLDNSWNDKFEEQPFVYRPENFNSRSRRDVQEVRTNPDGTRSLNVNAKLPLTDNDKNVLSVIGEVDGVKPDGDFKSAFGKVIMDYKNGHRLSVTGKHNPDSGSEISAAGKVNVLQNQHHDLSANAFATKTMPSDPKALDFNTYGGGLDYKFKDKIDANLGYIHTNDEDKLTGVGKLKLLHNDRQDLSANVYATKTMSLNPEDPDSNIYGGRLDYKLKDKIDASLGYSHMNDEDKLTGAGKVNLLHNDHHDLSANAYAAKTMFSNPKIPDSNTYGGGLDYKLNDIIDASLGYSHTNDKDKLTGAGKVNFLHNDHHDLSANAFATKTMSLNPKVPDSNTFGGGLNYKLKDKIDASLGFSHTDDADKITGIGKVNLLNNDRHELSANVFASKTLPLSPKIPDSYIYGGGLDYKFKDKIDASLSMSHTDDADKFTGVGKVNLLHNDHHDLSANVFASRTIPFNPIYPKYNTYGGGLDYNFDDKIGASLKMSHSDLFKTTDISALGNLHLLKSPTSSLDFSGGASRSFSPFNSQSSWQPFAALTFKKTW